MRTIDARHLDVPTEELVEYIIANIRMSTTEQQIIVTPTQLDNLIRIAGHLMSYSVLPQGHYKLMGVQVKVQEREPRLEGIPFPEPTMGIIIDESQYIADLMRYINGQEISDETKNTQIKKKSSKPKSTRRLPVWED